MKKKFAFVSDFDKTMTREDFYVLMLDKALGEPGWELYRKQRDRGIIGISFLNSILEKMNMTEKEVMEEIKNIPLDPGVKSFINKVKFHGGDFIILSAGADYYIKKSFRCTAYTMLLFFLIPEFLLTEE